MIGIALAKDRPTEPEERLTNEKTGTSMSVMVRSLVIAASL